MVRECVKKRGRKVRKLGRGEGKGSEKEKVKIVKKMRDDNVHRLRIGNGTTAPTSPLVPSEVKGLDMLSWHVGSVVEDESDVS